MTLCSKESLDFALDVPDASNVVVRTSEQKLALIAPLYWLYEVILIGPLGDLGIPWRQANMPELY